MLGLGDMPVVAETREKRTEDTVAKALAVVDGLKLSTQGLRHICQSPTSISPNVETF